MKTYTANEEILPILTGIGLAGLLLICIGVAAILVVLW